MQTYTIKERVIGSRSPIYGKPVAFEYEPGDYSPKDDVEAETLAHLAGLGIAELAGEAKTKHKRSASAGEPDTIEEA